ncbi:MAG TPA: hypothetical protein VMM60_10745 [Ilumatobacter sp.]|nr:hypothetical protein [Ilumatobacter sp.]
MSEKALRPFWIHQIVEYLIGIALISQGFQDPSPLMPVVLGGVIVVNAAMVRGPMGAFKFIGRRVHRWCDVGVVGVCIGAVVQPWIDVSTTGRALILVILLPFGFLWFYTDWAERPARSARRVARAGPRSDAVGRTAGRVAGRSYVAARDAVKKRTDNT